jgi:hypothetical protein
MAITALKHVVCIYTYKHIHIPKRCGMSQSPPLGPSVPAGNPHGITPFLTSQQMPTGDPHELVHTPTHLRLGNVSDTFCNDPPQTT